jgi:S-DNA-T family DNA segregation ATPase FtsK/SpoIIIE
MTTWQVCWTAGPDAGASRLLAAGTHLVGRAPQAAVRCADPLLEPFHLRLDLSDDRWQVCQLAGRLPIRCGPDSIEVGTSTLRITRAPAGSVATVSCAEPGTVVRAPRAAPQGAPVPLVGAPTVPTASHLSSGLDHSGAASTLVPAAVACAAAMMVAALIGQPLMALFAVVGLLASGAGAAVQFRGTRRRHRSAVAAEQREAAAWRDAVDAQCRAWTTSWCSRHGSLADRLAVLAHRGAGLWERRPDHGDAFTVPIGTGSLSWSPVVEPVCVGAAEPRSVDHLPVVVDLVGGAVVAVRGPLADSVVRSCLVQLACQTGPADWRLVVLSANPERWSWCAPLPQAQHPEHGPLVGDDGALAEGLRDDAVAHTVVVTDRADLLTVRTSMLRRMLAGSGPPAVLLVSDDAAAVPAVCTALIDTRQDGGARFVPDTRAANDVVQVRLAGLGLAPAADAAARLARFHDPEDPRSGDGAVPTRVDLVDLLRSAGTDPLDPVSIAAGWRSAAVDAAPACPLGRTGGDARVDLDLVADGPHGLVAGTTGAGKSELLRSLVTGLACRVPPDQLAMVLVDYKGGAAFDSCARLPHVVAVITDLDGRLAERALRGLQAELARREHAVRCLGAADLAAARRRCDSPVFPRLLVVVDEFAALAAEQPSFLHALVGIAQRGRSLGLHLLLATQRPAGVVDDDIRANTQLRLALRLHDRADALDVVGDPAPAMLSRRTPGRAVLRLGADELITFQTALLDDGDAVVDAVRQAAGLLGAEPPGSPWSEPLPAVLSADEAGRRLGAAATPTMVGVIDLPDERRCTPLEWGPSSGALAVLGAPGSGVSSTLVAVARAALSSDGARGVLVLDAGGDPRWDDVARHPRCTGVVRLHERERLWRAFRWVADRLDAAEVPLHPMVVLVDGLGALRRDLDDLDRMAEFEVLQRALGDTSGRVAVAAGADGAAALPGAFVAHSTHRWVLHLHDRGDAAALGVSPSAVPPAVAGRVALPDGTEAQVVAPSSTPLEPSAAQRATPVRRVEVLPPHVDAALLPPSRSGPGSWWPVLGVDAATLDTAVLEVPDGEHLLVVGPARSGRSNALRWIERTWLQSGAGASVWLSPRAAQRAGIAIADEVDGVLATIDGMLASGQRCLVLVDDAERVPDGAGRLEALVSSTRPGLTVVAAGRAEALRTRYGDWTAAVRRSRLGLVAASSHELDGDILGVTLPRRCPVMPRPGLMHLVDHTGCRLLQVPFVPLHDLEQPSDRGAARAHRLRL